MKFFSKRAFLIAGLIVAFVFIAAIGGILAYVSSPEFNEKARRYLVREIETETGGHVTLGKLYWNVWNQQVSLIDLTVRGAEPSQGPALAHIDSIDAGISLRSLLKQRIDLFKLTVTRPVFHLYVDEMGNTNLPSPRPRDLTGRTNFQLSIDNFKVAQGEAFVNEGQIDLDFALRNLTSNLSYRDSTRVLTARLSYEGVLERGNESPISYSLDSELDYTRGTLLANRIVLTSGKSQLHIQGRINDVLTNRIAGKLDYSGTAAVPFMSYFFPTETFSGNSALTGTLEFAKGSFRTYGNARSESIGYDRWNATSLHGDYEYRYPEKTLTIDKISAGVYGGYAGGNISVESIPGPSRVRLNLTYTDIDGVSLSGDFPWDPKYRIESRISGKLQGWFEGRLERFDFKGDAALTAAIRKPEPGILSLPIDGTLGYTVRPGDTTVTHGNFHLLSTSVVADGSLEMDNLNLKVQLASSDLKNLNFLYPDANGTGSFEGFLTGPIKNPRAQGIFDLRKYKYRDWTIEQASGTARLDTGANTATLTNVRVVQGQSQITLNGTSALDATKVDLRIQSAQVHAEDIAPFVKQQFGGVFSGAIHVTSLNPMQFDGDVHVAGLVAEGQSLRDVQAHLQYDDPIVSLQNISIADNGSTLIGRATYNPKSEAMTFAVRINSVDLNRLRSFGMPDAIEGRIQQADLTGSGTRTHPEVNGTAQLQNLAFHGESFPTARVRIDTAGSQVSVRLFETSNLDITAKINTSGAGYPFTAQADFKRYSIERLAGFTRGTLTVTGNAELTGSMNDIAHVTGKGQINPIEIGISNEPIHSTKPFKFSFNSEQLKLLDDVALVSSGGTEFVMNGTVGLTSEARLDLNLSGKFGAGLLTAGSPWTVSGLLDVRGQIRGTVTNPDLQGQASFEDLGVARQGVTASLTALHGSVIFDEHRITINNVEGRSSGGNVTFAGTAIIEGSTIGALNVRVVPTGVRVRYPTGLRSIVGGTLIVGGTMASPTLSGDLQIQSLSFNSSFEEFLALFEASPGAGEASPLGSLRLSLRVTGSRNISIQNELATAEARIDLGIKGTLDNPALTGRVETNKGTLLFQGKKYDVTRGNIDFVDPVRIDPNIDIQAETSIRNYLVYLSITGRIEHLQLNMRSEPPLPQLEIVNLISGGKTTDEFVENSRASLAPTGEQVFQGGAASILSDMLVSRVGSKLSLLGLDRNSVRIDPFVVGAQNSTTARITLSKQVTKELSVTYSQDLASNKQQIIQIEYFITRNVSLLASKDENNEHALDLRIRKRF